ncbi:MAG: hypothetical protein HYT27_00445 [Parcubacteria group bacterium]|nr:hypothetical protein [Parcubacteria group bacterium]
MKAKRTSTFLMANLGSEMSQLFSYTESGEWDMAQRAAERAEKIIAQLFEHRDLKGRTGEIEILREIIHDIISHERRFIVKKSEIEDYFLPLALRATHAI